VTSRPATGLPAGGATAGSAESADGTGGEPGTVTAADPRERNDARAASASTTPAGAATSLSDAPALQVSADALPAEQAPATVSLPGDRPVERHRLSSRVTRYWRWRALFSALPVLALLTSLAIVVTWGPWWVRWGIVGVAAVLVAVSMVVLPPIRYRVFWYALSATDIDIQHGIIFIKRTVVPMHRVQNLRTERGPMADHYRMTNLKIKTAAGSVTISGLDRGEADQLCDQISRLADVADDV
jgi:uncharacterized protein